MRGRALIRDRRFIIIVAIALVAAGVWLYALLSGSKWLDVTIMDVGEGLCVVAHSPSGKTMVMDCGTSGWRDNTAVGRSVVVPYLRSLGKDLIDIAVLSHPHADHVSGYAGLLDEYPADLVIDIGVKYKSAHYKRFLKAVKKCGATYRIAKRGQVIDMGDGVSVQVLHPAPQRFYSDLNNRSIVLRIVYGKTAILLAGDTGNEAEDEIIASGLPLRAQVLQVGHHGGRKSTSSAWLSAVRPSVAIISCGKWNDYGHPSREVVRRLESFGTRVYRTDQCGAVTISTDGSTIRTGTTVQQK